MLMLLLLTVVISHIETEAMIVLVSKEGGATKITA